MAITQRSLIHLFHIVPSHHIFLRSPYSPTEAVTVAESDDDGANFCWIRVSTGAAFDVAAEVAAPWLRFCCFCSSSGVAAAAAAAESGNGIFRLGKWRGPEREETMAREIAVRDKVVVLPTDVNILHLRFEKRKPMCLFFCLSEPSLGVHGASAHVKIRTILLQIRVKLDRELEHNWYLRLYRKYKECILEGFLLLQNIPKFRHVYNQPGSRCVHAALYSHSILRFLAIVRRCTNK